MNKIRKIISIAVIFFFSINNIYIRSNFAYNGRPTLFNEKSNAQRYLSDKQEQADISHIPSSISIPQELGRVLEFYKGEDEESVVVHIQDRHADPIAQFNISRIIDLLHKKYNIKLLCLEGASTEVDTSFYDQFADGKIKDDVTKFFVKKAFFTGSEYYKIMNSKADLSAIGVEDSELYLKHMASYDFNSAKKDRIIVFSRSLEGSLELLKQKVYSNDLRKLDNIALAYSNKNIQLPEYLKTFSEYAQKTGIDILKYPNIAQFLELARREREIDFKKAEDARKQLIDKLTKELKDAKLRELIHTSINFRAGNITDEEFYDYLLQFFNDSKTYNLQLTTYNSLVAYIAYLKFSKTINHIKVFEEADCLEQTVLLGLAKSQLEKDLVQYSYSVKLLNDLYALKLTPQKLCYLGLTQNSNFRHPDTERSEGEGSKYSDINNIKKFLITNYEKYGFVIPEIIRRTELSQNVIDSATYYYQLALERDIALVSNTIKNMQNYRKSKSILITGGFHTQGITNILKDKGISYVVICPNVGFDNCDKAYEARLEGKLPTSAQLVEFFIQTLCPPILTASASNAEVVTFIESAFAAVYGITALNALTPDQKKVFFEIAKEDVITDIRLLLLKNGSVTSDQARDIVNRQIDAIKNTKLEKRDEQHPKSSSTGGAGVYEYVSKFIDLIADGEFSVDYMLYVDTGYSPGNPAIFNKVSKRLSIPEDMNREFKNLCYEVWKQSVDLLEEKGAYDESLRIRNREKREAKMRQIEISKYREVLEKLKIDREIGKRQKLQIKISGPEIKLSSAGEVATYVETFIEKIGLGVFAFDGGWSQLSRIGGKNQELRNKIFKMCKVPKELENDFMELSNNVFSEANKARFVGRETHLLTIQDFEKALKKLTILSVKGVDRNIISEIPVKIQIQEKAADIIEMEQEQSPSVDITSLAVSANSVYMAFCILTDITIYDIDKLMKDKYYQEVVADKFNVPIKDIEKALKEISNNKKEEIFKRIKNLIKQNLSNKEIKNDKKLFFENILLPYLILLSRNVKISSGVTFNLLSQFCRLFKLDFQDTVDFERAFKEYLKNNENFTYYNYLIKINKELKRYNFKIDIHKNFSIGYKIIHKIKINTDWVAEALILKRIGVSTVWPGGKSFIGDRDIHICKDSLFKESKSIKFIIEKQEISKPYPFTGKHKERYEKNRIAYEEIRNLSNIRLSASKADARICDMYRKFLGNYSEQEIFQLLFFKTLLHELKHKHDEMLTKLDNKIDLELSAYLTTIMQNKKPIIDVIGLAVDMQQYYLEYKRVNSDAAEQVSEQEKRLRLIIRTAWASLLSKDEPAFDEFVIKNIHPLYKSYIPFSNTESMPDIALFQNFLNNEYKENILPQTDKIIKKLSSELKISSAQELDVMTVVYRTAQEAAIIAQKQYGIEPIKASSTGEVQAMRDELERLIQKLNENDVMVHPRDAYPIIIDIDTIRPDAVLLLEKMAVMRNSADKPIFQLFINGAEAKIVASSTVNKLIQSNENVVILDEYMENNGLNLSEILNSGYGPTLEAISGLFSKKVGNKQPGGYIAGQSVLKQELERAAEYLADNNVNNIYISWESPVEGKQSAFEALLANILTRIPYHNPDSVLTAQQIVSFLKPIAPAAYKELMDILIRTLEVINRNA